MATIFASGGPFFIARRLRDGGSWQMNDSGFPTKEAALAEIAVLEKQTPAYEYSWADISDMKPAQINRTTGTKQ